MTDGITVEVDERTTSPQAPTDRVEGGEAREGGPRKRTRRGGRGRRRPSAAQRSQAAGEAESAPEGPEVDLDAQPGETARIAVSPDEGGRSTTSARRRRRGGRGRGTRTPTATGEEAETGQLAEREETRADAVTGSEEASGEATAAPAKRRRRRGGRGRGGAAKRLATGEEAATEQPAEQEAAEAEAEPTKRRRASAGAARTAKAEPARTRPKAKAEAEKPAKPPARAKARAAATAAAEPEQPTSTRLRRQRQSRQVRRRRDVPVVPVARVTDKLMVITEHGERDQIAVLEGGELVQHYVTRAGARSMVGNVYLGRVQNVLPGMEAAFVDIGRGRNAVLYAGEVNWSPEDLDGAPPRIERVLKSGQSVLVQVTKDPIGGKGARLTAQISLPGRYLVLAPNSNVTGISRRLPDAERRRLKAIYRKIRPDQHGLIVRTAAEGASAEALEADLQRLLQEWAAIEKKAKRAKAPAAVYEEPELTVRVVRDLFTDEEYRELVTDSPRVYGMVTDYLRDVAPDLLAKVRLHDGKLPAFEEFHIVEQIHKGLDRKVWLPSGGYIVIDRTEALTVIDVNTGKAVGKTNLEETVVNTNVEAAREIARQLRLRDIGGMIVIDFIDMLLEQNKQKVIDAMREALAHDKSRAQVFDISPLGLLEVTRKRVSGGLLESFSETCPTCEGRGLLLTYDVG